MDSTVESLAADTAPGLTIPAIMWMDHVIMAVKWATCRPCVIQVERQRFKVTFGPKRGEERIRLLVTFIRLFPFE